MMINVDNNRQMANLIGSLSNSLNVTAIKDNGRIKDGVSGKMADNAINKR